MKKKEKKQNLSVTILYFFVIICVQLIGLVIAGVVIYFFMQFEVLTSLDMSKKGIIYRLMYVLLLNTIISIIVAALTSKIPVYPVNQLINQLNTLASGDFKARLEFRKPIKNHPTFIELTNSFNTLAHELENTEVLRSDFINNFSHEFKTPIVSIAGFAKMLKKDNLSEEQRKEYLDIIEEEAKRLADMATKVLNVTKLENQVILTDVSKFNLSEQIRSSILLLEEKWTEKNLEFELDLEEHEIYANEELLKEVWINLLHNAVKFSPQNEIIAIEIKELTEKYCIIVSNKGEEISEENHRKLFQKFYQVDESHATEGYGVGLAIVKRVVELHQGTVNVECKEGMVSFLVELPKNNM